MAERKKSAKKKAPAKKAKARPAAGKSSAPAKKKTAARKKSPARKPASEATRKKPASAAKPAPKAVTAPAPRTAAPPPPAPAGTVGADEVLLGHVMALRPRIHVGFKPSAFADAKRALVEERYASIETAARAVADKAIEISNASSRQDPFSRR
jgi:hypothetical protein